MHPIDLGDLIDVDVGRELEDGVVLRGSLRAEQLFHHRDRAFVMLNHEREKKPVELDASRAVELRQLLGGQHSRHEHRSRIVHAGHRVVPHVRVRDRLPSLSKPALHERDLVTLANENSFAEGAQR